ncbi:MAG: hypothetical protein DI589_26155 [Shinella sp.]|nr:MAG: hypothetical protein DI589_26155 [Shinella sp.]
MTMPTIRQEVYSDIPEVLETLNTTTSMLEAFSVLLEHAHRSGEDLKSYSTGIERLFNQQVEDLKFIETALREQYQEMKVSKLEVRDLATLAQWAGVSPKIAANVVSIATGINLPESSEETYRELVETAQQVSFVRAMQNVADIEAISEATAVPVETVSRVLDEAYFYNPRRMAAIREANERAREEKGASYVGA